jgi:hypothetical protein
MCSLCGVLLAEHWAEEGQGRRVRLLRVQLLNDVLGQFGLELGDWGGRLYVVRDRKGGQAVVADLGSLWREAERLAGRPLDPLDRGLVAALRSRD